MSSSDLCKQQLSVKRFDLKVVRTKVEQRRSRLDDESLSIEHYDWNDGDKMTVIYIVKATLTLRYLLLNPSIYGFDG